MGLFDFLKKERTIEVIQNNKSYEELGRQIRDLEEERAKVADSKDLTPESIAGKKRKYHYKDVNIVLSWKYSGQYGETCSSIGMKRGDMVELLQPNCKTDDPEEITVNWKGIDIGVMKNNRLRSMVHQWKRAGYPVLSVVSQVGGEQKLFIEFAFYGSPKT